MSPDVYTQRHHAGRHRARRVGVVVFALLVLQASLGVARAPSKKQVDEALLRLPGSDLQRVDDAEAAIREADTQLEAVNRDLDNARKDDRAAKSWVDASSAVLKAIGLDRKASEAAARGDDLERLATMQVRSESSLKWRRARAAAAKERIGFLQAKTAWTKAELARLSAALKEAKWITYKASVESNADVDAEIDKAASAREKAEANAARAREKMEKAELAWQSAVATATALAP